MNGSFYCSNICNDGYAVLEEICDDKNNNQGDGCDSTCLIELDWFCEKSPLSDRSICSKCKDGIRIGGGELCDEWVGGID